MRYESIYDLTYGPYATAAFTTAIAGTALYTTKKLNGKYTFEHFYHLMFGMILICLGGGLLLIVKSGMEFIYLLTLLLFIKLIL